MKKIIIFILSMSVLLCMTLVTCTTATNQNGNGNGNGNGNDNGGPLTEFDRMVIETSQTKLEEGRQIFRYDTFGSEVFWGDALHLHRAIAGEANGGVGPGLSPRAALEVGLKVDMDAVPAALANGIQKGEVDLDDPANTLELLRIDAVIGVKGFFNENGSIRSVGITCAFCHTAVDNAFTAGIGHRLDGWPNRDLNVGQIVLLAPNTRLLADRLGVSMDVLTRALQAWGPGKYDAQVNMDGKAFGPNGKSAATLIPAAYGMMGMNLHTYTGFGSVPYWNAYVAVTQMRGQGTFFDPRLNDRSQYPVAVKTGEWNIRPANDMVTSKLAALHYYQISIPAPKPEPGSFDRAAADRGQQIFSGRGRCAQCHVQPLFVEPGWNMHDGREIGIDNFQANRSPTRKYRTTQLAGISFRGQGGYYHDGRFPNLQAVVEHYNRTFGLNLSEQEKTDLVEYLKSL